MTRLIWDTLDYKIGVDRGVFYPMIGSGEAWNGLVSVKESSSDSDVSSKYIDGVKVDQRRRGGHFSGTIESFAYPPSFYEDVLTQRRAKTFGMSYRIQRATGYEIHIVYNVLAGPSPYLYRTNGVDMHSWSFTTFPIQVPESNSYSAHYVIDSNQAYSWTIEALETILYGTEADGARLPLPQEIFQLFEDNSILQIIDNGDGSWTAIGPDSAIQMLDSTTFEITWPSAVFIDAVSYTIHSL